VTAQDRARLVARALRELPEPGDPRHLLADLLEQDLAGPEALEVLGRVHVAWAQLRDIRLERRWSSGYGWFLARNLVLLGVLVLLAAATLRPPLPLIEAALGLRRNASRRQAILEAYGRDLGAYLDALSG
jgi:hypothetical protein